VSILYLLIPLAVILMAVAIVFFVWTIRNGQYEDMEGPAYRILIDDDEHLVPGHRSADDDASSEEASEAKEETGKGGKQG